jgi:hypothetical protein
MRRVPWLEHARYRDALLPARPLWGSPRWSVADPWRRRYSQSRNSTMTRNRMLGAHAITTSRQDSSSALIKITSPTGCLIDRLSLKVNKDRGEYRHKKRGGWGIRVYMWIRREAVTPGSAHAPSARVSTCPCRTRSGFNPPQRLQCSAPVLCRSRAAKAVELHSITMRLPSRPPEQACFCKPSGGSSVAALASTALGVTGRTEFRCRSPIMRHRRNEAVRF